MAVFLCWDPDNGDREDGANLTAIDAGEAAAAYVDSMWSDMDHAMSVDVMVEPVRDGTTQPLGPAALYEVEVQVVPHFAARRKRPTPPEPGKDGT